MRVAVTSAAIVVIPSVSKLEVDSLFKNRREKFAAVLCYLKVTRTITVDQTFVCTHQS